MKKRNIYRAMSVSEKKADIEIWRKKLGSENEKERWEAAIELGQHFYGEDGSPELVWNTVVEYGCHKSEDVRTAVATCILEHILEDHFVIYFPKVSQLAGWKCSFL